MKLLHSREDNKQLILEMKEAIAHFHLVKQL